MGFVEPNVRALTDCIRIAAFAQKGWRMEQSQVTLEPRSCARQDARALRIGYGLRFDNVVNGLGIGFFAEVVA
jgi:hypothetical protein